MAAKKSDIKKWLLASKKKHTHMVVVCDEFDYEDFPVYVNKGQDVRKVVDEYMTKSMHKVMEVYSFSRDLDEQLNERRAYHLD